MAESVTVDTIANVIVASIDITNTVRIRPYQVVRVGQKVFIGAGDQRFVATIEEEEQ